MPLPIFKRVTGWMLGLAATASGLCFAQIVDHTPNPSGDAVVHIKVHADKPAAAPIPATIFGSFLEPIGRSTYGGIWAELLENGSLEDGLWSAVKYSGMVREQPELLRGSQLACRSHGSPSFPARATATSRAGETRQTPAARSR